VSIKKLQQLGVMTGADGEVSVLTGPAKKKAKKKAVPAAGSFAMEGVSPYELQANAIESKLKKRKPHMRPASAKPSTPKVPVHSLTFSPSHSFNVLSVRKVAGLWRWR